MKKLIAALWLTAAGMSQASAQFKVIDPMADNSGYFECGIVKLVPPDRDRDPIFKIKINVVLDNGKLTEMNVHHVSVSGKYYARAEQYPNSGVRQIPNKVEYVWAGSWIKNDSIHMNGHFYRTDNNRWYYVETQIDVSRNDRVKMQTTAVCHEIHEPE